MHVRFLTSVSLPGECSSVWLYVAVCVCVWAFPSEICFLVINLRGSFESGAEAPPCSEQCLVFLGNTSKANTSLSPLFLSLRLVGGSVSFSLLSDSITHPPV